MQLLAFGGCREPRAAGADALARRRHGRGLRRRQRSARHRAAHLHDRILDFFRYAPARPQRPRRSPRSRRSRNSRCWGAPTRSATSRTSRTHCSTGRGGPCSRRRGRGRCGTRSGATGGSRSCPPDEQRVILAEHGAIGMAFGAGDYAHDIRLACHGLDTNDNDFVDRPARQRALPAVGRRAGDAQDSVRRRRLLTNFRSRTWS